MRLNELFIYELGNLLQAEHQLLKVLPKISENVASDRLSNLLNQYASDIGQHIQKIENSFQIIEKPQSTEACKAMDALIQEARDLMNEFAHTPQLDAAIISAMQKIVHYKIVSYGCVFTWANLLRFNKVSDLMEQNLLEERDTDTTFSDLAENEINNEAFVVQK